MKPWSCVNEYKNKDPAQYLYNSFYDFILNKYKGVYTDSEPYNKIILSFNSSLLTNTHMNDLNGGTSDKTLRLVTNTT